MIRRLADSRLLRLFSTSVAVQAMLSATNFVVALLLIRYAAESQYGYFVIVQATLMLLVTAQGAWILGPLTVLAPRKSEQQKREMVGTVELGLRRAMERICAVLLPLPPLGFLLGLWTSEGAVLGAASVLAGWMILRREYLRSVLLIYLRPNTLFRVDAMYATVLLAGVALAVALPVPAAGPAVLALLAAAWVGARYANRALGVSPGWATTDAQPLWKEMRPLGTWAAVGATLSWVYMQGYNYILAYDFGAVAVAHVNAARLMLMPVVLMQIGVEQLLVPHATGWLHHEGLPAMLRRVGLFVLGLVLLDALYVVVLWFCRDWITTDVMRIQIEQRDLLILLWGLNFALSVARGGLMCGLVAMARFRDLAWVTAASAVVALLTTWFGAAHVGAPAAILGMIAGEITGLLGMLLLIRAALRTRAAEARGSAVEALPKP